MSFCVRAHVAIVAPYSEDDATDVLALMGGAPLRCEFDDRTTGPEVGRKDPRVMRKLLPGDCGGGRDDRLAF